MSKRNSLSGKVGHFALSREQKLLEDMTTVFQYELLFRNRRWTTAQL